MRKVLVPSAAVVALMLTLVACGSSSATKSTSSTTNSHGMTDQEMQCMDKDYSAAHPKACGVDSETGKVKPLSYTPDGLIDATKIDLSGVEGVSPEDQKAAEELLANTIKTLPKWSDYNQAIADGFQSIQDQGTGEEHLLHWDWIEDDVIFDPNFPESLVYKYDRASGTKTLEAAMFILPGSYTLDNPPEIDSPLMQFHNHQNLCFTQGDAPRVAGLTDAQGGCREGLVKFNPNIQVHVWIRQNDCGPFAALLGVGAGQIKDGEEVACNHDHGRLGL